jgi:hypothetical protein
VRALAVALGFVLAACGGAVHTDPVEVSAVLGAEAADAGRDAHDASPHDAACVEHDHILCQHPKR